MSNADRFRELDRLFQSVCDLPEDERVSRLVELAPNDAELRSEVLELLAADSRAESPGALSVDAVQDAIASTLLHADADPSELAGYRIVSRLGSGGMGVVYEAEQSSPRRKVALKVLKPGFSTPDLVRRFEFEAEALARLRHPGVAQIYEAGVAETPTGPRPFFAMELVDGAPLHRWTEGKTTRQRLEMLAAVCDAVQHAHAQGVLHRDLKPANILVTKDGAPKVLDFGVARAVDAETRNETAVTIEGQIVGTLPYMSPEQIGGYANEVDIRSDVYALGVLLFQLLAGHTPHDLSGQGLFDAARIIQEEEPTHLATIDARYKGDIDTIVRTATDRTKTRRYQTAAALADDIRRHLDGQTIAARPASAVYQLSRLAKRHKPAAIALFAAAVVIVGSLIAVTASLDVAVTERKEAERQAAVANAVTAFFNDDVLSSADPWVEPDPDLSVKDALERAVANVDGRFTDEPLTEAAVRLTAGRTLLSLGQHDASEPQLRAAVALLQAHDGEDSVDTAEAEATLAMMLGEAGEYEESLSLLDHAVQVLTTELGADAAKTQDHSLSLVATLIDLGEFERAQSLVDSLLTAIDNDTIADDKYAVTTLGHAGAIAFKTNRVEDSLALYQRMTDLARSYYGDSHPETMTGIGALALIYTRLGRYDESRELHAQSIAASINALGEDHPYTLTSKNNLALLLSSTGEAEAAYALFKEILDIRLDALGETHPDTMVSLMTTARHLSRMGRHDEAETMGLRGVQLLEAELGTDHPYTGIGRSIMAGIYQNAGKPEAALEWLDETTD